MTSSHTPYSPPPPQHGHKQGQRFAARGGHTTPHALPVAAAQSSVERLTYVPAPVLQEPVGARGASAWRPLLLWAVGVLGALGVLFGIFMVVGLTALSFGGTGILVSLAVTIPAAMSLLVIVAIILFADRWDPQPKALLLAAVAWGAAFATAVSIVVNSVAGLLGGDWFSAVISAPFIEELTKGLGLIVAIAATRRYFTGPLDGLVYGGLIGGGFAFVENILYYTNGAIEGTILADGNIAGGAFTLIVLVVIRGMVGILGHVGYTSMTGVIMGLVARRYGTLWGILVFPLALLPGILFHAAWNASSVFSPGIGFTFLMFGIEIFFGILWILLMFALMFDESRRTRSHLEAYHRAGWLNQEEVVMLGTWHGRRSARRWASTLGQKPVMKAFIQDATELAHTRQFMIANAPRPALIATEQRLLNALGSHRQRLLSASTGQRR